jgi:hypothetical protein
VHWRSMSPVAVPVSSLNNPHTPCCPNLNTAGCAHQPTNYICHMSLSHQHPHPFNSPAIDGAAPLRLTWCRHSPC